DYATRASKLQGFDDLAGHNRCSLSRPKGRRGLMNTTLWLVVAGGGGLAVIAILAIALGTVVIDEQQSGLVVRRYGDPLPPRRILATKGEAGYQARMLAPGWHFGMWSWKYKVSKVPLVQVPPGQIAVVVAKDGAAIPTERVLGREVDCDNFQDAVQFLDN